MLNSGWRIAALRITISRRGRVEHLFAKAWIDAYESMSRSHTSIFAVGWPLRSGAATLSPFSMDRTARMICERCRSRKTRHASRPMPTLLPVMIAVRPARHAFDGGRWGLVKVISTNLAKFDFVDGERAAEAMAHYKTRQPLAYRGLWFMISVRVWYEKTLRCWVTTSKFYEGAEYRQMRRVRQRTAIIYLSYSQR